MSYPLVRDQYVGEDSPEPTDPQERMDRKQFRMRYERDWQRGALDNPQVLKWYYDGAKTYGVKLRKYVSPRLAAAQRNAATPEPPAPDAWLNNLLSPAADFSEGLVAGAGRVPLEIQSRFSGDPTGANWARGVMSNGNTVTGAGASAGSALQQGVGPAAGAVAGGALGTMLGPPGTALGALVGGGLALAGGGLGGAMQHGIESGLLSSQDSTQPYQDIGQIQAAHPWAAGVAGGLEGAALTGSLFGNWRDFLRYQLAKRGGAAALIPEADQLIGQQAGQQLFTGAATGAAIPAAQALIQGRPPTLEEIVSGVGGGSLGGQSRFAGATETLPPVTLDIPAAPGEAAVHKVYPEKIVINPQALYQQGAQTQQFYKHPVTGETIPGPQVHPVTGQPLTGVPETPAQPGTDDLENLIANYHQTSGFIGPQPQYNLGVGVDDALAGYYGNRVVPTGPQPQPQPYTPVAPDLLSDVPYNEQYTPIPTLPTHPISGAGLGPDTTLPVAGGAQFQTPNITGLHPVTGQPVSGPSATMNAGTLPIVNVPPSLPTHPISGAGLGPDTTLPVAGGAQFQTLDLMGLHPITGQPVSGPSATMNAGTLPIGNTPPAPPTKPIVKTPARRSAKANTKTTAAATGVTAGAWAEVAGKKGVIERTLSDGTQQRIYPMGTHYRISVRDPRTSKEWDHLDWEFHNSERGLASAMTTLDNLGGINAVQKQGPNGEVLRPQGEGAGEGVGLQGMGEGNSKPEGTAPKGRGKGKTKEGPVGPNGPFESGGGEPPGAKDARERVDPYYNQIIRGDETPHASGYQQVRKLLAEDPHLTPEARDAALRFMDHLPRRYFENLTLQFKKTLDKEGSRDITFGNYRDVDGLIKISRWGMGLAEQIKRDTTVIPHELSHHLASMLPESDMALLYKQFNRQKAAFAKNYGKSYRDTELFDEWMAEAIRKQVEAGSKVPNTAFGRAIQRVRDLGYAVYDYLNSLGHFDHARTVYKRFVGEGYTGEQYSQEPRIPGAVPGGSYVSRMNPMTKYQEPATIAERVRQASEGVTREVYGGGTQDAGWPTSPMKNVTPEAKTYNQRISPGAVRDIKAGSKVKGMVDKNVPNYQTLSGVSRSLSTYDVNGNKITGGVIEKSLRGGPGRLISDALSTADYNTHVKLAEAKNRLKKIVGLLDAELTSRGLANRKANKEALREEFINEIEKPYTDKTRGGKSQIMQDAVKLHDLTHEAMRQLIVDYLTKVKGRTLPPDWGITESGHFKHVFMKDFNIEYTDKLTGQHAVATAPTYADMIDTAMKLQDAGHTLTGFTARPNDSAGPRSLIPDARFWRAAMGIVAKAGKDATGKNWILNPEDIAQDLKGVGYTKETQGRFMSSLLKRESKSQDFLKDYEYVENKYLNEVIRGTELNKAVVETNKILGDLKNQYGETNDIKLVENHLNEVFDSVRNKPTQQDEELAHAIRNVFPHAVANPVANMQNLMQGIRTVGSRTYLLSRPLASAINRSQTLVTLLPRIGVDNYVNAVKGLYDKNTQRLLIDNGVLTSKAEVFKDKTGRYDVRLVPNGNSLSSLNPLTPAKNFRRASDLNRAIGWIHGYNSGLEFAKKQGITGQAAQDIARREGWNYANVAEFNMSAYNTPTKLQRGQVNRLITQFQNYNVNNISDWREAFGRAFQPEAARAAGMTRLKGTGQLLGKIAAQGATGGLISLGSAGGLGVTAATYDYLKDLAKNRLGWNDKQADYAAALITFGAGSLVGADFSHSTAMLPDVSGLGETEGIVGPALGGIVKGIKIATSPESKKGLTTIEKLADSVPVGRQGRAFISLVTRQPLYIATGDSRGGALTAWNDKLIAVLGGLPLEASRQRSEAYSRRTRKNPGPMVPGGWPKPPQVTQPMIPMAPAGQY